MDGWFKKLLGFNIYNRKWLVEQRDLAGKTTQFYWQLSNTILLRN